MMPSVQVIVGIKPCVDPSLDNIGKLFNRLNELRFFGELTVKYENGVIQYVKTTETLKPVDLQRII